MRGDRDDLMGVPGTGPTGKAKRRKGGWLQGLLVLSLFAAIGTFAWFVLTNPWIFTVGRTRYIPLWQGMAESDGPGGKYRIYVAFYPTGTSTARASTWARGWGKICAPGGHDYSVRVEARTDSVVWKDMNGKPFHLFTRGSHSFANASMGRMSPPVIDMRGKWQANTIELIDAHSLDDAFNPDGTIADPARTGGGSHAMVFRETGWLFTNPCN